METGVFFAFLFVLAIVVEARAYRARTNKRRLTPLVYVALMGILFLLVFVAGAFVRLRLGSAGYIVFYGLAGCVFYTGGVLAARSFAWLQPLDPRS